MLNKTALLTLHIASLVLLGLGWTLNMLHINISAKFIMEITIFDEKRSVFGTLGRLWDSGDIFPFTLIFLFGIIVPLVKSAVIFQLLLSKTPNVTWQRFTLAISKWAMADVFAISIFIAFLGANAMKATRAHLEPGFYYFAGYVLLSGIIVMFLPKLSTSAPSQH